MPYFLRHYSTFCERIILYDDDSNDGTSEMAMAAGAEIRPCPWRGLDDVRAVALANTHYKEGCGQVDWVIWVDADEFIYHPYIETHLQILKSAGVDLPRVEGYTMFASDWPTTTGQIYEEIRDGIPDERYSKPVVLDPSLEMCWGPGRHEFTANAVTNTLGDCLKLLHYRWFGEEAHAQRNARNIARISPTNLALGLGVEVTNPSYVGHHSPAWYREQALMARPCL